MKEKKIIASIMLFLATLMWGINYSIQQMSASSLGAFSVVFFKGIGALILIPFLIIRKKKIDRTAVIGGTLIGLCAFSGCVLQQMGIESSTVSKASFITALYIVLVPVIEIFRGKKASRRIWLATGIALLGLYLLCFHGSFILNRGDILLLLGSLCFAFQIIGIDHYTQIRDPIVITFVCQTAVSVFSGIVMALVEKPSVTDLQAVFLPILYMVFISGILAQTLQIVYQKDVGTSLGSLLMSFESVFGALGGWIILGQTMSPREILGSLLVFIGIILAEG